MKLGSRVHAIFDDRSGSRVATVTTDGEREPVYASCDNSKEVLKLTNIRPGDRNGVLRATVSLGQQPRGTTTVYWSNRDVSEYPEKQALMLLRGDVLVDVCVVDWRGIPRAEYTTAVDKHSSAYARKRTAEAEESEALEVLHRLQASVPRRIHELEQYIRQIDEAKPLLAEIAARMKLIGNHAKRMLYTDERGTNRVYTDESLRDAVNLLRSEQQVVKQIFAKLVEFQKHDDDKAANERLRQLSPQSVTSEGDDLAFADDLVKEHAKLLDAKKELLDAKEKALSSQGGKAKASGKANVDLLEECIENVRRRLQDIVTFAKDAGKDIQGRLQTDLQRISAAEAKITTQEQHLERAQATHAACLADYKETRSSLVTAEETLAAARTSLIDQRAFTLRETGGSGVLTHHLNGFNHTPQLLQSAAEYESARLSFCALLQRQNSTVEDAITGVQLKVKEQLLHISAAAHGAMGHQLTHEHHAKWLAVPTIADLAPLLIEGNGATRAHGGMSSQPVIVCAKAGTGKTWSSQQLAHALAEQCIQGSPGGAVKFVPLLVYVQRLVRQLRNADTQQLRVGVLERYVRAEYRAKPAIASMLVMALRLKACVLVIDGIDEAAGQRDAISRLIIEELAPYGLRMVCTSRPEAVEMRLADFQASGFVVMDLLPLSVKQQRSAVLQQLEKIPSAFAFYNHLDAFMHIRKTHDNVFAEAFPNVKDRELVEGLEAPDRFLHRDGSRDGAQRARAADGGFVRVSAHRGLCPESSLLRDAFTFFDESLLMLFGDALTRMHASGAAVSPKVVKGLVLHLDHQNIQRQPESQHLKLLVKLGMLVLKLLSLGASSSGQRRPLMPPSVNSTSDDYAHDVWDRLADSSQPALDLWLCIVHRTDRIYVVAEALLPSFELAAAQVAPGCDLSIGPLKDPVRVYEKAHDDYRHVLSDWRADKVIPEASVLDVIRARVVCKTGKQVCAVITNLVNGTGTRNAKFELMRLKNKFGRKDMDVRLTPLQPSV